jgi:hypothetical protein
MGDQKRDGKNICTPLHRKRVRYISRRGGVTDWIQRRDFRENLREGDQNFILRLLGRDQGGRRSVSGRDNEK